ncbi:hypothetical protein [Parabacteroides sp. PF5-9]|uniref:hypothetical protein n=1 Tax=Parabacteroides sp. PF5-9 TaxID=1742404 RepID=UPI0024749832|nr:hypothetical protein [Parabacteroides sp. PF5-9]MDH6356207.1 hypothetical protein [Parabacteroides sp. PF5-9]
MDKLKNFIDNNREAFENELLPEGHFERFKQKLPVKKNHRPLFINIGTVAVAASIILLLFFRLPLNTVTDEQDTTAYTCETKQEIEELRLYYNMQINEVIAQMETLYKNDRNPGAEELLKETKKVLTDNYMFEENILPTLPCSNNGLYAMTQHYNNSLESLSFMLELMEHVTDHN